MSRNLLMHISLHLQSHVTVVEVHAPASNHVSHLQCIDVIQNGDNSIG